MKRIPQGKYSKEFRKKGCKTCCWTRFVSSRSFTAFGYTQVDNQLLGKSKHCQIRNIQTI